jgi:hypothetical protein
VIERMAQVALQNAGLEPPTNTTASNAPETTPTCATARASLQSETPTPGPP